MNAQQKFRFSPIQKIVLSFFTLILIGTLLLLLPWATTKSISFIDALFTSTSAVCVTGLIVVDTAKDFTLFGQIIILALIQLGGFGIMTFSVGIISLLGGDLSIKWRVTFESVYSSISAFPIRSILKRVILYTLVIETVVGIILFTQFSTQFPVQKALWYSIFHAVSAFCNAGFSTFSDSMVNFNTHTTITLALSAAVILGGLGFIVLSETSSFKKIFSFKRKNSFSLHTSLVLWSTVILLCVGTGGFLLLEWNYTLQSFSFPDKVLNSFFQSMSCRTAGFNSIDIGSLRESTLFLMMSLMFIGGAPGSIAGGIKITTIAVVFGLIISKLKGKKQVTFWNRALSHSTVEKSTTLMILSLIFIYFSTFLLLTFHSFDIDHSFISGLFEITSAFGTVGLSTGVTSTLFIEGKILLLCVMFVGRLGPLTLIAALTSRERPVPYTIAEESIMIG